MHDTTVRARLAATLALSVAAALALPTAAHAATTDPGSTATSAATSSPSSAPTTSPTTTSTTSTATSSATTTSPSPGTGGPTTSGSPTAPTGTSTTGSGSTSTTTSGSTSSSTSSTATQQTATPSGPVAGGHETAFGMSAAAALPATSTDPALTAAGFLERQLAAGGHHLENWGSADYGLTIDAVLALDAAGAGQSEATAATSYVASHVKDYISPPWGPNELYAGATAKAIMLAVAQGVDPTAFGGVDLVATLRSLENGSGRYSDVSQYGDYSNTIGQSLGVLALTRSGAGASAKAVSYLRGQQCADGGFRLDLGASDCTSDPDATSFAVQALLTVGGAADGDAAAGLDYLAAQQQANGGLAGAGPTSEVNANSTGLAGQAFVAGGRTAQARAAAGYLTGLQLDCSFPASLRGAVAYTSATRSALKAAGSGATATDQERRATAQAAAALAGSALTTVSAAGADATAPDLACAAAPSPSTTATSATPSATTTAAPGSAGDTTTTAAAPGGNAGATGDPADSQAASPGSLAFTGADVATTVLVALLLLALGAGALVVARRKGAHA